MSGDLSGFLDGPRRAHGETLMIVSCNSDERLISRGRSEVAGNGGWAFNRRAGNGYDGRSHGAFFGMKYSVSAFLIIWKACEQLRSIFILQSNFSTLWVNQGGSDMTTPVLETRMRREKGLALKH